MDATDRPSLMPLAIATLCAIGIAAVGCFRLVEEWKMSVGDGVLLFGQMMFGPFSRAFLHGSGGLFSVTSSPALMVIAAFCLFSFVLPVLRKKKSSIYVAAAGSVIWIISGAIIVVGAGM